MIGQKFQNATTASLWAVVLFLISVVTRFALVPHLPDDQEFAGGILRVVITKNFGLVFSISLPQWLILVFTLAVLGILSWIFFWTVWSVNSPKLLSIGFGLIAGGALANFYERAMYGHVVDYLQVSIFGLVGAWNIADIGIIAGIILWIVASRKPNQIQSKKNFDF